MTMTRGVPLAMLKQKHNGKRCTSSHCIKKERTVQWGSGYLFAVLKRKRTIQRGGYLMASKTAIMTQQGSGYLLVVPFFLSCWNVWSTCTNLSGNGCASLILLPVCANWSVRFLGVMVVVVVVARECVEVRVPSCHGHLPSISVICG